jgi:predicted ABC-type transport system involved in lysophospholipase L1 biosynthesis ATPase subunit
VTIYLAVSTENVELPLKIDEQRTIEVTMRALVSEAYGTGRRLGHYGPADVS